MPRPVEKKQWTSTTDRVGKRWVVGVRALPSRTQSKGAPPPQSVTGLETRAQRLRRVCRPDCIRSGMLEGLIIFKRISFR